MVTEDHISFKPNCSGIILAGGLNRRMGGRNKALIRLGSRSFLDHILETLRASFADCLIAARNPSLYDGWGVRVVRDRFDACSPLTGIHAGLMRMKGEYAFVTSCDTPLLKKEVVDLLVKAIRPGTDVIVPASGSYFQPMCAVYSARCARFIEDMLRRGDLKADRLYQRVHLKTIAYAHFEAVDPHLTSFFNVNTPDDLLKARDLYHAIS